MVSSGRKGPSDAGAASVPADGRLKIDAPIVQGAPEEGFLPGDGRNEWFQDHPLGPEMVVIPAGWVVMGSPAGEEGRSNDEEPQHRVTFKAPFALGRFAVTLAEFVAFAEATGYLTPDMGISFRNPGFAQAARHPAVGVSWEDAAAYCLWLSRRAGKTYSLCSEAEWEYACRAGSTTPFWFGPSIFTDQANYDGNYTYGGGEQGECRRGTVPADSFEPNAWGLYQMHGNVWEWCADAWHENYRGAPDDGSIWQGGDASLRVVRGGSWNDEPSYLRSAYRDRYRPVHRLRSIGFRVVRTLFPPFAGSEAGRCGALSLSDGAATGSAGLCGDHVKDRACSVTW